MDMGEKGKAGKERNVVVKGFKVEEKEVRSVIGEIFKRIGAEMKVEEVRAVRAGREKWGEMAVKLETEEGKREVMRRKKGLRGGTVWIEVDLTWKERRSRWRFREAVKAEEKKRARVEVNKAMINEEWWFWEEEVLRKWRGVSRRDERKEAQGEEMRRA